MAGKTGTRETWPANKRGLARLAAVQALYQMEISGQTLADTILEFQMYRLGKEIDGEQYREADEDWFRDLLQGMVAKQREIDPRIHTALQQDWPLKRIDSILRAVLRVGVYELMRGKEVPARVIISEYVEVAKAFFSEDEPKVVNGVLDRIGREIRPGEFNEKPTE
ncbi:transcription antitermination factor NusB [Breoghania sp.]|uniref:transcription antitermination factor NusB n=1 Tax=Breoghania sp. TaxID=2065378 RepID=UPI0026197A08|nr:transcription antitermination factor NusB [Breoghania sp.]MDJ0932291.1 transcription antitermination factor NusB [Breoghania sp.]